MVYVYAEGEVTEREYIDIVRDHGVPLVPGQKVDVRYMNLKADGDDRKPLPMVEMAIKKLREAEREAERSGLDKNDKRNGWRWPQVWVFFDRDDHPGIIRARKLAAEAGVYIAYSYPCFELWRLLHYQNYTSTFGRACHRANELLRGQPGFAQTYGRNLRTVSEERSKHVHADQILSKDSGGRSRYLTAKGYAKKINEGHGIDPNTWDPYTDVFEFVEKGLLVKDY
ncbi:RloB family protein [Streptomyces sp. SCA3-4]|uniref:RloB family protein n=1 Tax=Streptomyces sichuanensis TaxID=2871810 RepID=UPI001CE30B16|nr:RloB family protein [Streptomyces sichuanensis]MCA6094304.1 RloB family protein [Streptomyces sichuanensis]